MDLVEKNRILKKNRSHRAVAPIIATLILVAIAVVGGVMIFTFSQGFFGEQQVSTAPTIELITMIGYDARAHNVNDLTWHNGDATGITGMTAADAAAGTKGGGDNIIIYLRNGGEDPVTIVNVQALGNGAGTSDVACADVPAADELCALTSLTINAGSTEGFMIETGSETVNMGRQFAVKVTTANGAAFDFNLVAGQRG